jgi:hypothetical protein
MCSCPALPGHVPSRPSAPRRAWPRPRHPLHSRARDIRPRRQCRIAHFCRGTRAPNTRSLHPLPPQRHRWPAPPSGCWGLARRLRRRCQTVAAPSSTQPLRIAPTAHVRINGGSGSNSSSSSSSACPWPGAVEGAAVRRMQEFLPMYIEPHRTPSRGGYRAAWEGAPGLLEQQRAAWAGRTCAGVHICISTCSLLWGFPKSCLSHAA